MQTISNNPSRIIAPLTAAIVTTAAYGKLFVPFYLIGSTAIFVVLCLAGAALVAFDWRSVRNEARYAGDILGMIVLLYAIVIASYLVNSLGRVPPTHLLGILIFHGLFLVFGFAAARAPKAVFAMLLTQAAIYLVYVIQYAVRFGDVTKGGFFQDVFGVNNGTLALALDQHIGEALGLAVLAALGFGTRWVRLATFAALPFVLLFIFHIGARSAIVALLGSLFFLAWAELWGRSRKLAVATVATLIVCAAIGSALFYQFALHDRVNAEDTGVIARTIKEIQSDDPGFRLPIWERSWQRIVSDPHHLLLGKGIGSFTIDEGLGPPDWLLRKTEAGMHSPHNIHLDMLYESGILGMLMFTIVAAFPILVSLRNWKLLSASETSAISLYIFWLLTEEISGNFAFGYYFQFFLALAIGVVSLKRKELAEAGAPREGAFKELTGPIIVH